MNEATVRLIQNSREAFKRFSWEQLYQTALSLRDELAYRDVDCLPEADALMAALLVHAQQEHRTIFSADCSHPTHCGCSAALVYCDPAQCEDRPAENS